MDREKEAPGDRELYAREFAELNAGRADAERKWRDLIVDAHFSGLSERAIAPLAGISHQRVHQILEEDRPAYEEEARKQAERLAQIQSPYDKEES